MELLSLFQHNVPNAHDDGFIDLFSGCFGGRDAEIAGKLPFDQRFGVDFRSFVFIHICSFTPDLFRCIITYGTPLVKS